MNSANMRRAFAGCVAVLVVVAFAGFYGYGIVLCWKASAQKPPIFKPEYVYVATALAGLIGGVTAMVFNEKLPDAPPRPTRPSTENPSTPSASGLAAGLSAIKRSIIGTRTDLLTIVSAAYVAVYFVTCIGAIVTWIKLSDQTPDLIKNLALIGIGLFVAIARSFFNVPPPKDSGS